MDSCVSSRPVVKVSWSGGKDSTAAMILHLAAGHKVKAVCYIPMFTEDIPLISRAHYEFLKATAAEFHDMGADIMFVHGMTYWNLVTRVATRGKYKGRIFGFPCYIAGKCNFRVYSKVKALDAANVGDYDFEDIGIAFDEKQRHGLLTDRKRSILAELSYTENDAYRLCEAYGMLSPIYAQGARRDGCALCPHASEAVRKKWYADYPEAVPYLRKLQEIVLAQRPERLPLRGGKLFLEG